MLRLLITAVALASAVCTGQTPDLVRRLSSGVPRDVAWAAFTIGAENRSGMIPGLAELLEGYRSKEAQERGSVPAESAAMEAVADALIRLQAKLPAETVMHLYPEFPAQTLILLAGATDNSGPLMDIFQTAKQRELWLAAGDLLALHPPSGFVRSLLAGAIATFVFDVVWADDQELEQAGGGCAGDFMMVPDQVFADWPKARMYRLVASSKRPPNIFAPGVHPVGFASWATTDYRDSWEDGDCTPSTSRYWRAGLVAQLLGKPASELPLRSRREETLRYTSDDLFADHVGTAVRNQARSFVDLVEVMVQAGLLSAEESRELGFHCVIEVSDHRPLPHGQLPDTKGNWCLPPPEGANLLLP